MATLHTHNGWSGIIPDGWYALDFDTVILETDRPFSLKTCGHPEKNNPPSELRLGRTLNQSSEISTPNSGVIYVRKVGASGVAPRRRLPLNAVFSKPLTLP